MKTFQEYISSPLSELRNAARESVADIGREAQQNRHNPHYQQIFSHLQEIERQIIEIDQQLRYVREFQKH